MWYDSSTVLLGCFAGILIIFKHDIEFIHFVRARTVSYIEYRTPTFAHAAPSAIEAIDNILEGFLQLLGITMFDALFHFNVAPLKTRRDIAMLGIIHRTILGKGPPHFRKYFIRVRSIQGHSCQIYDPTAGFHQLYFRCSIFGMARQYNRLPASIVNLNCVRDFQSSLQDLLKEIAITGDATWPNLFRRS